MSDSATVGYPAGGPRADPDFDAANRGLPPSDAGADGRIRAGRTPDADAARRIGTAARGPAVSRRPMKAGVDASARQRRRLRLLRGGEAPAVARPRGRLPRRATNAPKRLAASIASETMHAALAGLALILALQVLLSALLKRIVKPMEVVARATEALAAGSGAGAIPYRESGATRSGPSPGAIAVSRRPERARLFAPRPRMPTRRSASAAPRWTPPSARSATARDSGCRRSPVRRSAREHPGPRDLEAVVSRSRSASVRTAAETEYRHPPR